MPFEVVSLVFGSFFGFLFEKFLRWLQCDCFIIILQTQRMLFGKILEQAAPLEEDRLTCVYDYTNSQENRVVTDKYVSAANFCCIQWLCNVSFDFKMRFSWFTYCLHWEATFLILKLVVFVVH